MTAFALKLIAIIAMLFDHSSFLFYGRYFSWMRCVGRIAFPIFAFQICQGFLHTKNLKKYYLRLIIFALISEIPYAWFTYTFTNKISINVIFTLILGLISINIYDYFFKKANGKRLLTQLLYIIISLLLVSGICILAEKLKFDYGYFGVLLIFSFYIFNNNKILMNLSSFLLTCLFFLPRLIKFDFHIYFIILLLCTLLSLLPINLYNGKKGKDFKWMFYVFYPLHLTLICILYYLKI